MNNYRLRYTKEGNLRLISHLDLIRSFERAMRRGNIPIAFSEGFHPHPLMSFGPALSLGIESCAEFMDITLKEPVEPSELLERLNHALPEGLRILEVRHIQGKVKPLTAVINRATYHITFGLPTSKSCDLKASLERLWGTERLEVQRRAKDGGNKLVDIRPLWHRWEILEEQGRLVLEIEVEAGSQGAVRPDEFVRLIGEEFSSRRVLRWSLWVHDGTKKVSPMELC